MHTLNYVLDFISLVLAPLRETRWEEPWWIAEEVTSLTTWQSTEADVCHVCRRWEEDSCSSVSINELCLKMSVRKVQFVYNWQKLEFLISWWYLYTKQQKIMDQTRRSDSGKQMAGWNLSGSQKPIKTWSKYPVILDTLIQQLACMAIVMAYHETRLGFKYSNNFTY